MLPLGALMRVLQKYSSKKGYEMTYYIQRKDGKDLETVDEFETYKEAKAMVKEYRLSDSAADYYISSRCCKHWRAIEP